MESPEGSWAFSTCQWRGVAWGGVFGGGKLTAGEYYDRGSKSWNGAMAALGFGAIGAGIVYAAAFSNVPVVGDVVDVDVAVDRGGGFRASRTFGW